MATNLLGRSFGLPLSAKSIVDLQPGTFHGCDEQEIAFRSLTEPAWADLFVDFLEPRSQSDRLLSALTQGPLLTRDDGAG